MRELPMDTYILLPVRLYLPPLDGIPKSLRFRNTLLLLENTSVSQLLTLQLNKRNFSGLVRSFCVYSTGNHDYANIEISLAGIPLTLKGIFTRNPRPRGPQDGEPQPPPSPSSARRSER